MAFATDRFLAEIRKSHQVYSYVDVISANQEVIRLPTTDGDVRVDRTAQVRRTCSVKAVDPLGDLTPRGVDGILTPFGTEVRPYRGVRYSPTPEFPEGEIEVYPLGVFRLAKAVVDDTTGGSPEISLEAFDLSRTISRDKFTVPYTVAEGANIVTAIQEIVALTFPDVEYDAISSDMVTTAPLLFDAGNDPWEAVTSMARSLGCEIYFDVFGRLVLAPPDDIDALPAPDFTYIEGQNCTMTDLNVVFSDEPGFNGVVLTGESAGDEAPPVRSIVWDEEPTSPTYHLGPYGEVPMFVTDNLVKTQEEADAAATSLLNGMLGFSSQLSITATVNPSFEGGDVVEVVRERSGISGLFAVDAFNIPLQANGTQGITLRQKRSVQ